MPLTAAHHVAPAALPQAIEIFRAGRHIDDAGQAHAFSPADIEGMAASYDPALREAPLTVGHPKDNLPAYGWVQSLQSSSTGVLTMSAHQVEPQFAEMARAGRFKKRSASFYPPHSPNNPTPGRWYLRHVAFLGAQPPAVAGLKDLQFCDSTASSDAVSFSSVSSPLQRKDSKSMNEEELKAQLAQTQAELTAAREAKAQAQAAEAQARQQAASFAEQAQAQRRAGFVAFCEVQVQAGKLLPKDQPMAVATLELLANAAPVEFAEGDATRRISAVVWLQDLLAQQRPAVNFGEFSAGRSAAQGQGQGHQGQSDAQIDQAARAHMRQHNINYSEALQAVTAQFSN